MRILVYEFASGGGLAGRAVPASLAREGAAMRTALVRDLVAMKSHQLATTADRRIVHHLPSSVAVTILPDGARSREATLDRLIESVDAVWLIAPESDRCLERLAARVECRGKRLLGSSADAIARASDKARLPACLAAAGVAHPTTRVLGPRDTDLSRAAVDFEYPIVVKPARGAGSHGVGLAANARALDRAVSTARRADSSGVVLLQRFIRGRAASVSLLANDCDVVPLALNTQELRSVPPFSYRGGVTPYDHRLAPAARAAAVAACRALPGLRGFVGVDLVLAGRDVFVIEVNPRLTTAYLGVRAAFDENVGALALAACEGALPDRLRPQRRVGFSASGRVVVRASTVGATRVKAGTNSPEPGPFAEADGFTVPVEPR